MDPKSASKHPGEAAHYEALLQISSALASGLPEDFSQFLKERLDSVLQFDFLSILVLQDDADEMVWQVSGTGRHLLEDLPMEETVAWWIFQNQQELSIQDWRSDDRFGVLRDALRTCGSEMRSVHGVPLTTSHRRVGVLTIASKQPDRYTEEDRQFLSLVAGDLALAINNGLRAEETRRVRADLERQNMRLRFLLDLSQRVTSNLELQELLREISASIRQVMQCDGVGITLPTAEAGQFRMIALDFPQSKGLVHEGRLISPRGNIAAEALTTLKPVIANPLNPAEYSAQTFQLVKSEGVKAQCFIPLVNRQRAVGMLMLLRVHESPFTKEDTEFLSQMAGQIAIAVENALAYQEISSLKDKLAQEKLYLEEEIRSEMNFGQIIGKSPTLHHALELSRTVASSDSTVLLFGETGTGKELIARAIHELSGRKTFVKVNCAAIPTGLLESELFGHEKGAFTGALAQKRGRFELADQGSLFLDEVGDIDLVLQPKLLRVLQEKEFERLGSTRTIKVDVRLIAATRRDLPKMVEDGQFREDLYYRLNVFPIYVPPLRERKEDIPLLVHFFVGMHARNMRKSIRTVPREIMDGIMKWDWPGNVRELQNFIERSVILSCGTTLDAPISELKHRSPPKQESESTLYQTEREAILNALRVARGKISGIGGAAERLGLKRTTLQKKMERLQISKSDYVAPERR